MLNTLTDLWNAVLAGLGARLFSLGDTPVTAGGLLRVFLTVWVAALASRALQGALGRVSAVWHAADRSTLYTLGRIVHYSVIGVGIVVGLSTIGVDFTNLAILLGALGVGIGFGLQDMVANFISGLVILFERHLRVGDFIELESGVSGEVREVRMRATRVTTRDNIDILVPNSEFVRGRVVNWTLDDAARRVHVPFGVAYGSDKAAVRAAGLEAAAAVPYTLTGVAGREPQVWLVRFGDSSLDFELIVWLTADGVSRPQAVQAAYLWALHDALGRHGIEIPFPQRDVHVRSLAGLDGEAARNWLRGKSPTAPSAGADPGPGATVL
ncbi:MAG: mechanosensitive ion channel family protein [Vicinamibacterales bacterium]